MRKKSALAPVNKLVPIIQIKAHPDNYNTHPEAQVRQLGKSYSELGQFRSVVLWEQSDGSYIQLAGHGVVEGMRKKGAETARADVFPPSLDPLIAKQIMLADNLHAHNSVSDDDVLTRLLQEQHQAGIDMATLGTDNETLRQMLDAAMENGGGMPNFGPGSADDQGQLDERAKITCPHCGEEFEPE